MKQRFSAWILGTLTLVALSAEAQSDRLVVEEVVGKAILSDNPKADCAARLMDYRGVRFLEMEVDGRSVDFDLTEQNSKEWKGRFKRSVPGSGGFGSYTPAEKSSGTMEVTLDSQPRVAKVVIENCVERTFLGTGTGTFRCKTTRITCTED
jgi:hypothetical protein